MGIYTSLEGEMVCPLCGDTNTHLDRVAMASGAKDGENASALSLAPSSTGEITAEPGLVPASKHFGDGHRIALIGWCESCFGRFAFVFTQHKGVTLVESVDLGEHVLEVAS